MSKGRYRAQLLLGETQLASSHFQVEDFVSETMKVNITGLPAFAAIDQALVFSTESLFLFGAPGAVRPISEQLLAASPAGLANPENIGGRPGGFRIHRQCV
jgi:uncharacterized protein YfaS (alpha-2-macroglobulin family)